MTPQELFEKIAKLFPEKFYMFGAFQFRSQKQTLSFEVESYTIDDIIEIAGELGYVIEAQVYPDNNGNVSYSSNIYSLKPLLLVDEYDVIFPDQRSAYYAGLVKIVELIEKEKSNG